MSIDNASSLSSDRAVLLVLLSLLDGLSSNVMSGDVWWLAEHQAMRQCCQRFGMTEEQFSEVMVDVRQLQQAARRANPMSSMFD
ncbi:hypothetical protein F6X40_09970 [Paraburkholderia sp. UCT31]|uniref:hypothetical protein n=1 Tax=Paraburkholderia sp. UCT31 TaxID=2615209 RepID=UPI00165533B8|nr:hypothetical protein [Paraburkholderia sp. UCT31]MBC8737133.1 hypothetical protein [Paraburkholderia sp. UCT31]